MLEYEKKEKTEKAKTSENENRSFHYLISSKNISKTSVINLLKEIENGTAKEYFKSQKPAKYRKFSKKIVGKVFKKEIIENDRNQAVFLYSKHCHACKNYGSHFENFALENIVNDTIAQKEGSKSLRLEFNRMNSDLNTLDCAKNFPYTPIFMVFKDNHKYSSFVYRSDKFTPQLLKDFITVTCEFEVIPSDLIDNAVYQFLNFKKKKLIDL